MPPTPVKRSYDGTARRARAAQRRARVVDRASERFLRAGFAGTTIAAVAAEAGVSVEFVYKGFGGKAGLVRAVWENALAGRGIEPAERRSEVMSAQARTGEEVIAGWARLSIEVGSRAAPVLALVRDAAVVDEDAATLLAEIEAARGERMMHNARVLADAGFLRSDLTVEQARDVLLVFSAEFFDGLVCRRGWDPQDYVAVLRRGMGAALLEPGT